MPAREAAAIPANIGDKAQLENLVVETRRIFGRIDVLVCNAASNPFYGPMAELPDDAFEKILHNNVISNHWLCNLVLPEMAQRKDGSIIIVSSIGGLKGTAALGAMMARLRQAREGRGAVGQYEMQSHPQ